MTAHFDLRAPRPWIGGHRGAPAEGVLENSLPSLRRAVERGADFVEIDVRLTADGELVVAHDADLGRVAGRPDLVVERSMVSSVHRLVPTLAEALDALPPAFPVNLDVKRDEAPIGALARRVVEAVSGRAILVSSFDWALLEALRREAARLPLALLAADEEAVAGLSAATRRLAPWSWHVAAELASEDLIRLAPVPVLVYTVNDPAAARRHFEAGVAGLFSDDPAAIARLRQTG